MSAPPLRAPAGDGEVLARPSLARVEAALHANRLVFESSAALDIQGKPLGALRAWTRRVAIGQSQDYTHSLAGGEEVDLRDPGPLIVTGHQPALFHPGVCAKNFAVYALADRHGGTGLNLIVDNDQRAATGVAVPRGPRESPRVAMVPLLSQQPAQPWEETQVNDEKLFQSFGARCTEVIETDWGYPPILSDCWTDAVAALEWTSRAADCLTAMRWRQERRWGMSNFELPLSRIEETDPFRWFTAHLLAGAARFCEHHNAVLADYRRRNRIRSRTHPVPELRQRDGWIETPFWVWRAGEGERRGLFVRTAGQRLQIAANEEIIDQLRLHADADACCAVEDLAELSREGWKLRSRALTTTLFARLFLSDLFVHGIGGAKYDEMTDRIIERFFGMTAPGFLTLTATLRRPLEPFEVTGEHARKLQRRLRELRFNPERVLSGPQVEAVRHEKSQLIRERLALGQHGSTGVAAESRRGQTHTLHTRLRELSRRLADDVRVERQRTSSALETVERHLEANRILKGREYAWCLFPEDSLQSLRERIANEV